MTGGIDNAHLIPTPAKSNEDKLGDVMTLLVDILQLRLQAMKTDPDNATNVSLLKEARELLKQHNIEMDPTSAKMQDLKTDVDELDAYRNRRGSSA